jgi:hypothetical protein
MPDSIDRRDFLKNATALGAASGLTRVAGAARPAARVANKVVGANDRINVGVVGCGSRGFSVSKDFAKAGDAHNARIAMVCDVYQKRVNDAAQHHNVKGTLDYRE